MDNKTMLEGILWDLKELSELFMHGCIETNTKEVHSTFINSLNEVLTLQNDLFTLMTDASMYEINVVTETKLETKKEKYKPNLEEE